MKTLLNAAGLALLLTFAGNFGAASAAERGDPGYCDTARDDPWCAALPLPDGGRAFQPPAPPPLSPSPPPQIVGGEHPNDGLRPPPRPRGGFGLYLDDDFPDPQERLIIRRARFCTNDMAVNKALALGIRKIRAYAYPDYVVVKGRRHGHRVEVVFSRARGCPVIQY